MQFEIAPDIASAVSWFGLATGGLTAFVLYRLDKRGLAIFDADKRPKSGFVRGLVFGFLGLLVGGAFLSALVSFVVLPWMAELAGGPTFQMQGEVKSLAPAKRTAMAVKVQLSDGQWVTARPDWWIQFIEPQIICGAELGSAMQVIGFENSLGRTYKEMRAPSCYLGSSALGSSVVGKR